jgi:HEAT repeat protein
MRKWVFLACLFAALAAGCGEQQREGSGVRVAANDADASGNAAEAAARGDADGTMEEAIAAANAAVEVAAGRAKREWHCADLDACLADLRVLARRRDDLGGMDRDEDAWARRIVTFDGAVAKLMPLLADPDEKVAEMAAIGLQQAPEIDGRYLPQVLAAIDRDLDWADGMLGRVPTDAAAREAVERVLTTGTSEYVIVQQGKRAIPHVVAAVRCGDPCGKTYRLHEALQGMGETARLAVPGLVAILEDPGVDEDILSGALHALEEMGPRAIAAEPAIEGLRKREPTWSDRIDLALEAIGSSRKGALLAARLARNPSTTTIEDVARAGAVAKEATPTLRRLLQAEDRDVRVAAARALGYIDGREAIPDLVALLRDDADLRLPWAAAEALGRLRARTATMALAGAAKTHWHPAVREKAAAALALMEKPPGAEDADFEGLHPKERWRAFVWLHSPPLPSKQCDTSLQRLPEPTVRLELPRDRTRLEALAYAPSAFGFGTPPPPPPPPMPGAKPEPPPEPPRYAPHLAVRVEDGWLAAADRGEWGGELVFVPDHGKPYGVFDGNTGNLHRLGDRLVAVTGLGHMGINRAHVYEIARDGSGRWAAKPWRQLPQAPADSYLVAGGELAIEAYSSGTVLLAPDGSMRMAPCAGRAAGGP